MSFGSEVANSWTMSPAPRTGRDSSEYTMFFKNCFGTPSDGIWSLGFVEHLPLCIAQSVALCIYIICGPRDPWK